MLDIKLLGTPEILLDNLRSPRFRTRKAQALLFYLAVTEQSWTRDALATLFWPETSDARARKNLRDILPSLRRQLGDYLLINDEIIGMNPAARYTCDVTQFSTVLEQPLQDMETRTLTETLDLYRGAFLEGHSSARISADFELWVVRERERLHQLALMGFTALCRRQQAAGKYEAALATNRQLLKFAPWDEAAHRRQMLLLAQSGQRAAALAHYETCRQALADELDVEPGAETVRLYEQIQRGDSFTQDPPAGEPQLLQRPPSSPVPHNLPRQLTSLIGRGSDIVAVQRLLDKENTALLTLVGPGGVGKTRLALAVAQQVHTDAHERFPDGIWFVPLAGIAPGANATEEIASAIAQAMELSLSGSEPPSRQLLRALREQQLLLIVDNFEHLVAEQAFLLEVVQTAQRVKMLITSRAQMHLHAEFLYPVSGLPVPLESDFGAGKELALLTRHDNRSRNRFSLSTDLGKYASVRLFVTRVQQRLPEFRLTTQNQYNIGRICRLLDGVPLGIELTAQLYVEQGASTLAQLIQEIEELDPLESPAQSDPTGLDHLQTPAIDLPARQRSIRAVFEHSWRLLSAAEQALLCHCAIFRGGFTREAILTVAEGDGANLLGLVMKSLVRRDSHDRYDLHELIRQYVIDQFQQEPAVVHTAAQKHATYFVDVLAGQEEKLLQESTFHQTIQTEIYNLRAAWAWCVDRAAVAELDRCVICLFIYLRYARQVHQAVAFATQAMHCLRSAPASEHPERVRKRLLGYVLIYAASAGIGAGLVEESEQWLQEAKAVGEALGDSGLLGQIHATLMIRSSLRLENQRMFAHAKKALHHVKEADTPHLQPVILRVFGIGLAHQGEIEESFQVAAELQQLIQTRHYACIEGEYFFLVSKLHEIQRDWEAALLAAQQGWTLCQERALPFGLDNLEGNMIWANLQLGNFAQARELALGFGQRARRSGLQAELLYSLQSLGEAEVGLGNWGAGESYLAEALRVAVANDSMIRRVLILHSLGMLRMHQEAYDQAAAHFQEALHSAKTSENFELQLLTRAGLALTHLRQGEPARARMEVASILDAEKVVTPDHPDHVFIGLVLYQIMAAHQDPRAAALLEQLYQEVRAQATKIKNRAQRRIFLENILEHREILALWQANQNVTVSGIQKE